MGGFVLAAAWAAGWDRCFGRLPNGLMFLLAVWAWWICPQAWWGALVWAVPYAVAWMMRWGIGGGDVKLAVSMGIVSAQYGLGAALGAMAGAALFTLIEILLVRVVGSGSQPRSAPHGPGMVAAMVAAVWLGG